MRTGPIRTELPEGVKMEVEGVFSDSVWGFKLYAATREELVAGCENVGYAFLNAPMPPVDEGEVAGD